MKNSMKEFIGITIVIIALFLVVAGMASLDKNNVDLETSVKFKIYSKDINTEEEIIIEEFGFFKDIDTIDKRLNVIASNLSRSQFKNLPIELIEVEEIEGQKVAVFNLKENEENLNKADWTQYTEPNWAMNFFQGSAGGSWTLYTLQTTMLQPDYDGEWIDGVRFLYNGEESNYFQHMEGIERIKYR